MAYWNRRKNGYVYVYTMKDGKQKALPRKETKHLDDESDCNIDSWVRWWSETWENKKFSRDSFMYDSSELSKNLKAYISFMKTRARAYQTVQQHESVLRRFVIPFFLDGDRPLKDPQQWPGKSIKMLSWLQEQKVSPNLIHKCNVALRSFYRYLSEEGVVQSGVDIKLRNPISHSKVTPLKTTLVPATVLQFARNCSDEKIKLMALLGYFFSLRPQETFALMLSDFRAGTPVESLDCAKAMSRVGCDNRLAVKIDRQIGSDGDEKPPKVFSRGWVCCFNEDATKMIVELLQSKEPKEKFFSKGLRQLYKKWDESGLQGFTLKDLRRSSLYHLGHFTNIQPLELMKHARHQSMNTTMLYLRRPEEDLGEFTGLALEA